MASVPEYTKVTVADGTTTVADSDHNLQEDQIVLLTDAIRIMSAKGSILVVTAQGAVSELAIGTNSQAILADSAQGVGIKWGDIVLPGTLTTKGDIYVATSAGTLVRLAVGANDTVLTADSGEASGLKYAAGSSGSLAQVGSTTLGSSQNSISISSIPATKSDLFYSVSLRSDYAAENDQFYIQLNDDSGSNYAYHWYRMTGGNTHAVGASLAISAPQAGWCAGANSRADTFSGGVFQIPQYASTDIDKQSLLLANTIFGDLSAVGDFNTVVGSVLWDSKVAINKVAVFPVTGSNFVQYSTLTLWTME